MKSTKPPAKTAAERQQARRDRLAETPEVRGIRAPRDQHARIRAYVAKMPKEKR
jgi:hypothetical protein